MQPITVRAAAANLARAAYEPLAPFYDSFTAESKYEPVLDAIETWARAQGLRGKRLLDVACGTGKSFEPLLARGYEVTACDLSPAMVAEARRNWAGVADIAVADMRSLPWECEFDLITCVDDAINYMLDERDLRAALTSMARALRPDGIAVFDANTIRAYRTDWSESFDFTEDGTRFSWRGECSAEAEPGVIARATVRVEHAGGSCESRHVERHWRVEELRAACLAAGFQHVVFRGLAEGPRLVGEPDEERHLKLVCLAARPTAPARPPAG
jgi:SAM-dependent methyltransferase